VLSCCWLKGHPTSNVMSVVLGDKFPLIPVVVVIIIVVVVIIIVVVLVVVLLRRRRRRRRPDPSSRSYTTLAL